MAEQLLSPRKRRRQSGQGQSPSDDALQRLSKKKKKKKQKFSHPTRPPPSFWDNLSKVPLTRGALRELDRRNTEGARPARSLSHRPVTRRTGADARGHHLSATDCLRRVERSARHGGPDLSDLRGCRKPSNALVFGMSSSQSSLGRRKRGSVSSKSAATQNTRTATTKSTGPYDRAFQQHLIDFGIYPDWYEYPDGRMPPEPENIEEIRRLLIQPRPSLSPSRFSDEDIRKFKREDTHASKERQVTTTVIPIIEGDIGDRKCVAGEIPFTNLDHLTDGTLVPGNPDLYYGARPEQLNRQVRARLNGRIVPSTQHDLPIAPNFFLAAKGPDGSLAVAQRQACYDGALGARGMRDLLSYGTSEPVDDDNKAHTITCTYHGGQLKMYTSHRIPPASPGTRPEYVMTQVDSWSLTGNTASFRVGAAAFRNARDWAKRQRDEAISRANERGCQG